MALMLLAGCSDTSDEDAAAPDAGIPAEQPNEYFNEVDGISISWPEGWRRAEDELNAGRVTNTVELISLATYEEVPEGECPPGSEAAGPVMAKDDVLFTLRMSIDPAELRQSRPADLMASAALVPETVRTPEDAWWSGCYRQGAEIWESSFQEHDRHYEAFVATHSEMSEVRRAELQDIWSKLQLTPLATGDDNAEAGREYWHTLYTHCGVKSTSFDGREWVADPQVSDGQGNPPRGWANPTSVGTIELKDENTAVFTSRDGERTATFRPRTSQDPPLQPCA